MIRRTPVKRRRKPRRGPMRDLKYRRWLSDKCACLIAGCYHFTIDPAHTKNNGMSSKGPDSSCVPLCRGHHEEYDAGKNAFEKKYRLDMTAEAKKYYELYRQEMDTK